MKKEQKSQVVHEIAAQISGSEAIYAADYRGLTVSQAATLRARLRDVDTSFRIVKNTLTLRAADEAGAETVKELVDGPTAFAFVKGDPAMAAKAIDVFARQERVMEVRGGVIEGKLLSADDFRLLARLPAREQLIAQLAGVVASPVTGLVRGLGSLLSGLAIALGQVRDQMPAEESPPPKQEAPAAEEPPAEEPAAEAPAEEASAEDSSDGPAAEEQQAEEEKPEDSDEKEAE